VRAAQSEITKLLTTSAPDNDAALHLAQGYCQYFFFDAQSAAESFDTAIERANFSNPVQLSFAYNGLGISKQCLCEFGAARQAFLKALELSTKIGDDSRASLVNSNLSCTALFEGNYAEAIQCGIRSLELGRTSLPRQHLLAAYVNLTEAYLLTGCPAKGLECLEQARLWKASHPTWRVNFDFLLESACIALMLGNVASALDLTESAERVARHREHMISQPGTFEKLRAFRAAHVVTAEVAMDIARRAQQRFRQRHPLSYLDALAATAWLERRTIGRYSNETETALAVFETVGAKGKRDLQRAEGFLD
jgi:tetratricopeptide (TPR) repeat protein